MSTIGSLASTLLNAILPANPLTGNKTTNNVANAPTTSVTQPPDVGQLSSFAQLAGTLQQLEQSNPAQFAQVTQQISTNLQTAAQTASANGNTAAATQLNQLAKDFSTASGTGQLPNLQDLAQALGGHHHHRYGGAEAVGTSTASTGTATDPTTDPATIIRNALASAGVGVTVG